MLHRRTYDVLTKDSGVILHWEYGVLGGLIAVRDEVSAISVWHEGWDEALNLIGTWDLVNGNEVYGPASFREAQEFGKVLVSKVLDAYVPA